MYYYLEAKLTVWEQAKLSENQYLKAKILLEKNPNLSYHDLLNELGDADTETLFDTESCMKVEDNHGKSTLELVEDKGSKEVRVITFKNGE